MRDDIIPELGALDLGGSGHQSSEIIRNPFAGDGAIETPEDQIRGFAPTQVAEHHLTGEHHRSGIDPV
jgi:hypothetical protein